MSFRAISLEREELPWTWTGAHRQRAIITVRDREGRRHEAELAPCPGVHPEILDEALFQWQNEVEGLLRDRSFAPERWNWTRPAFGLIDCPSGLYSSVLTALEQLLLSWAQAETPEEFSLPAPMTLEGSALLSLQSQDQDPWKTFQNLWAQGFRIFKVKVGRQAADREYAFLQAMKDYGAGALRLRLDANRGMNTADLDFWSTHQNELPLVYWEEAAGLKPDALDESLWDRNDAPNAAAWILKPSRLGLSQTVTLLKKAATRNIPCVLSNAFDSGLSLRAAAWIYAAFCAEPQALGYGTTRFLPADRWQSAAWGHARVVIPTRPFAAGGPP